MKIVTMVLAAALLAAHTLPAQPSRTDSLSQLIAGTSDPNEKARLLLLRSKSYAATETDKPMADARQALAAYQQSKKEEGQVDAYLQVSVLYSRQSKYRLALEIDSTARELAGRLSYTRGMAMALSQMGRNQQQLGDLKAAEENCLHALQLFREAGLESETADVHSRLGVIYRRLSEIKKSLYHYDEGIAVAKKFHSDAILGVLYMNKANSLNEAARYDEAIEMHLQSIRIKEKLRDERGLMQSYNNIALVYMRTGQPDASIGYFRQANELARRFNNKTGLGYNYVNLATLYINRHHKDSVPYFYEQALAAFNETGEQPGLGLVYHNYGNFLLEENKLEQSEQMLRRALDIRRQTKAGYDIASTMNVLGSLMTHQGRMKESESLLLESLAMLKDENSRRRQDAYKYLSEYYKAAGDYEEAYNYQAGYISMRDTLATESEVTNMLRAQAQYEVEKRDAQLLLQKKDNELQAALVSRKNQQLLFLLIALVLALLLSSVYFINYRNKKQHAAALELKNSQIETLIRELHHRVKNNLQVVSGLLSLQSGRLEDDKARQAMEEGRARVDAMAMIHQKLYMDKDLAAVDIRDYLDNLSLSLASSFGYDRQHIQTTVAMPKQSLDIDTAIPIGLIVNELVTNAFKHAFRDTLDPRVNVSLERTNDGHMLLTIADNGRGVSVPADPSRSFGMKLVHTLVEQLNGTLQLQQDNGTAYRIQIRA
ncbi:MAG: tetratricopeptide repeat protein [Chitinophagaceae bacterium]